MATFRQINPFAKRESHSAEHVKVYKFLTIISWLLVVISAVYYTFNAPNDDKTHQRTIWGQNSHYHTAFAMNSIITSIYWIALLLLQVGYVSYLFSSNADYVQAASAVGSHFIWHNLLTFGFIMLFVRSHFIWAELILIIDFFNLSFLYFRHNTYPRFIHIPVVSGPLAWVYVAIFWNGAIAVNATGLAARILGNIAIWGILVYGLFFLVVFKDYTIGFELSVLSFAIGVSQFLRQIIAFQWIFGFTIGATLFVATLLIAIPGIFGKEFSFRREGAIVDEDRERAPLLDDH